MSFTTLELASCNTCFCSQQCAGGVSSLLASAAVQAAPLGNEESEPKACDPTVEKAGANHPWGEMGKKVNWAEAPS